MPIVLCLAIGLVSGCIETKVVRDGWGGYREDGWATTHKRPQAKAVSTADQTQAGGWAIQVAALDGPDRQRKAKEIAKLLQQRSRMTEIWTDHQQDRTRVLAGRYRSGDDWGALEDLNHLRFVQVDDTYPFASAELIPLGDKLAPGENPYDLKRYVGMFTLQIGFYDDVAGPDYRKLAEQAVKTLRDQGEQAYFYHGPHRALICLGLFTENDFAEHDGTRAYGPRIRELQEKYPYNLANGYTQIEKQRGQLIGEQPSFLVRVF